jgi:hypothetical protein
VTPFRCEIARSPREIADAQRVRWIVYGEEEQLLPPAAGRDGREIDARDHDGAVHLLAYAGDEPVGTIRLLPARAGHRAPDACRAGALGLDLESRFVLTAPPAPALALAEVTRYCVVRRYRCTPVARMLHAALAAESRRRGITRWLAAANMETDVARDAALVHALVCTRHLVDPHFHAEPRPPAARQPMPGGPPRAAGGRRCYTDDEHRRAADGYIADLRLPRTIALFTTKLGARCIGAPAYDPTFNVFALPIVANVPPALAGGAGATPSAHRLSAAPPPPRP